MQLQRNFRVMRRHNLFSSIWCLISWSSISGTSYFTLPGDPSIHPIQSTNSTMVLHPSLSRIIWLHFRKYYQLDIRKDAALGPRVVWARERAKDAGYSVIIIIGFGLLVGAFYSLFRLYIWSSVLLIIIPSTFSSVRNIFSSHGTTVLFNKAVADCLAHERVTSILGKPIKAFGESIVVNTGDTDAFCTGEETRRGHRGHIPAYHYIDPQSGRRGVLIRFYLQGVRQSRWELGASQTITLAVLHTSGEKKGLSPVRRKGGFQRENANPLSDRSGEQHSS